MRYLLVLSFLLTACRAITGCDAKTHTIEAVYNDGFYDTEIGLVNAWRQQGYTCTSTAIRNGLGTQIGDSYVCTNCL